MKKPELFVAQAVLFCSARTTSISAPANPFLYQRTTALRGQSYSLNTGYFTPPVNGTYVFHLSSAVLSSIGINFNMYAQGSLFDTNILYSKETSQYSYETTSLDFIYTLSEDAEVHLDLKQGIAVSDYLKQTSWSAFLLDNIMHPLITFCAARTSESSVVGKVQFTSTLVNLGNAWDVTTNTFTAPQIGTYVFSMSSGVLNGEECITAVVINNKEYYGLAVMDENNGTDIASRSFAITLAEGDTVFFYLQFKGILISDATHQMSFAGFLYEPLNGRKVIWSVHQTNNQIGAYTPFPFNKVSVNEGNGWKAVDNKFVVPYAGVYQLHLTATLLDNYTIDYRLMWNDVPYANIYSNSTNYNRGVTRSRGIMIEAAVGDIFYIATTSATSLISNVGKFISFTGYLVSP